MSTALGLAIRYFSYVLFAASIENQSLNHYLLRDQRDFLHSKEYLGLTPSLKIRALVGSSVEEISGFVSGDVL